MAKRGTHARQHSPVIVLLLFVLTGFVFVTASISADGDDLRPAGGDIGSLLQERAQRIEERREVAKSLRAEIDALSLGVAGEDVDELRREVKDLEPATGLTSMEGPGLRVTLDDAPDAGEDPDVDPNLEVVHQQDIQAYVNALWAGGAEAVSLQGQRLMSTTGIVCVGNSVILDGVPYSPPYVIDAIGDTSGMERAMNTAPDTVSYARYVQEYQLGLSIERIAELRVKAYENPVALDHATAPKA